MVALRDPELSILRTTHLKEVAQVPDSNTRWALTQLPDPGLDSRDSPPDQDGYEPF